MFLARLADLDTDIEKAGRQAQSAAIDRLVGCGHAIFEGVGAEVGDLAVFDEETADRIHPACRIE